MNKTSRILFLIFLTLFSSTLWAQNITQPLKRKRAEAADLAFNSNMYSTALKAYRKAYRKEKDKEEKNRITFQMAECYRLMGNLRMAEPTYRRLIFVKYEQKQPIILRHLGDIQRVNGKLAQARDFYEKYLQLVPDDELAKSRLRGIEATEFWLANPTRHVVENEKLLNSRDDDFAATYSNSAYNEVVFTTNRKGVNSKGKDEWTTKNFTDLFIAKKDVKAKWSQPVNPDEEGILNTPGNEGSPFFNSRMNAMYFTRCAAEPKRKNTCKIFVARRAGKSFSEPTEVEIQADSNFAIGHPTLSNDELTIIFSSDLPNGKGAHDLWYATRESKSGRFGKPRNLGDSINTRGEELFPFLRFDTILYFASDGHPGLGGLDIFKSYLRTDTEGKKYWTRPINMGSPINSPADDFAITFHPEEEESGFFSSNRKGGRGGDDIYSFVVQPVIFTLEGIVKDASSLQPIQGALVELKVSDGRIHKSNTSDRGRYTFNKNQVLIHRNFEIAVSKEGYFSTLGKLSTMGLERSQDFKMDFMLQPIPRKPIVLPEILYDLARWELKPQYQDSLQGLITLLEKNPNLTIELAAHTDARDTEERNDILSQKRAQSVVDYLILRGIDPDRLTAKGYGERVPRVLNKDVKAGGYVFKAGSRLTESFIDSLPSKELKEIAHQLNRRTEFTITGTNFKPKPRPVGQQTLTKEIEIVTSKPLNTISFSLNSRKLMVIPASIDTYPLTFIYQPDARNNVISAEAVLDLLKEGIITKDDFKGNPQEIISEGAIQRGAELTIPSLRIGRKVIYDIDVVVEPKSEAKLIINKTTLIKFGAFTINEDAREIIFE